jgi:S1-C subfamily serine protease
MQKAQLQLCVLVAIFTMGPALSAQEPNGRPISEKNAQVPVDTQLTIEASAPVQKAPIRSVLYMECKKRGMKGTAFLLSSGVVVTAAHVVCGCSAADVDATTTLSEPIHFSALVRDEDRDIAALVPTSRLSGGLELAPDTSLAVGQQVNTWGFPLIYNGPAPLLSVGYVSGLYEAAESNFCDPTQNSKKLNFKHIVVNGAFNPGNSGGPLFVFGQNKVVGIVIWKSIAFSNNVKAAIDGFHNPRATLGGTFTETLPDGTTRGVSDSEVMARVLEEFYTKVQVDIGEAVSSSEIRAFVKLYAKELSLTGN